MSQVVPELSVIIPAFDAHETLGEQLQALTAEDTTFPWEVLVCDNGSRDGTRELVRRWQRQIPELRLVDASARRGPSAARNIGAAQARGRLLAFCDADDVVGPGWVACMRTALTTDVLVTGNWEGDLLSSGSAWSVSWTTHPIVTKPFLPWLPGTGAGNLGVHRSVFEQVGGFEELLTTGEDVDLTWRIQLAGHRLVHHPEIVLHVRRRDGLWATFRQAYAYGAGDRQLRARWAPVIAAFTPVNGQASAEGTQVPAAPRWSARAARVGRTVRNKVTRGRAGLAESAWRIGERLGNRWGPVDHSIPPVDVPPRLPTDA